MKQRMYNVFYRKFKNQKVAMFLSKCAYFSLYCIYLIVRLFLKGELLLTKEEARKILENASPNPGTLNNVKSTSFHYKECKYDLSVIIPAYNVEAYIEKCIDSVISQETQFSYEIIIVNDGATDNTYEKILKYEGQDNLVLLNQVNKGLSGARNTGINQSQGKYLMFVDSDDYLCEGAIQKLMERALTYQADIVQGSYFSFNGDEKFYYLVNDQVIDKEKYNEDVKAPGFAWGKVFKRECFENIRFPEGFWYEDTIMSFLLFPMCRKYVAIRDTVYAYRVNTSGITFTSKQSTKSLDSYWIIENLLEERERLGLEMDTKLYTLVKQQLTNHLYRRIYHLDSEVVESAFILSGNLLSRFSNEIVKDSNLIEKDLTKSFKSNNYKLWKMCSFIVN